MTDLLRMEPTQIIACIAACVVCAVGAVVSNVAARREANRTRPERD